MAPDEWRASLTASARYENIERIAQALAAQSAERRETAQEDAFEIESQAFATSLSRDEYDEACSVHFDPAPPISDSPSPLAHLSSQTSSSTGVHIGPYTNCVRIDEGLTSTVYRSSTTSSSIPATASSSTATYALKVVQTYHCVEPHSPHNEIKILQALSHANVIPLLESFRDQEQHIVLVFPYKPLTLNRLLTAGGPIPVPRARKILRDVLEGLAYIHERGIIHRDIKPSAVLLDGPDGPAYLSDFGTAWHPQICASAEPQDSKILDIGTGPYRPPDALMGNKSYSTAVDMWSFGVLLSECASASPNPTPVFESPPTHEDGSQLGLILSIFRTLGTPTPETWPEASKFRTSPFGMWRVFEPREPDVAFEEVRAPFRGLMEGLLKYESSWRLTAKEALEHESMVGE